MGGAPRRVADLAGLLLLRREGWAVNRKRVYRIYWPAGGPRARADHEGAGPASGDRPRQRTGGLLETGEFSESVARRWVSRHRLMGHSSVKTTMDRYMHVSEEQKREAIDAISEALLGG
jgi:integrase